MKPYRIFSWFVLLIVLLSSALPAQVSHAAPALSLHERLVYQRALDAVTWENTLFPAREVVSRILKDFEEKGMVKLKRGMIFIQDREALFETLQTACG